MQWDINPQVPSRVPRPGSKTVDPGPIAVSVTGVTMHLPPFDCRGGGTSAGRHTSTPPQYRSPKNIW
jgi:hypothetical protein